MNGESKTVVIDEGEFAVVDGKRLPVRVVKMIDEVYLVPVDEQVDGIVVAWPILVDEVIADMV